MSLNLLMVCYGKLKRFTKIEVNPILTVWSYITYKILFKKLIFSLSSLDYLYIMQNLCLRNIKYDYIIANDLFSLVIQRPFLKNVFWLSTEHAGKTHLKIIPCQRQKINFHRLLLQEKERLNYWLEFQCAV